MRRAALILAWGLGWPALARADAAPEIPVQLVYEAPAECPNQAEFEARVRTTNPRIRVKAAELRAQVRLVKSDQRYTAIVRLSRDGDETVRELPGESCEEVHRAAALVVAVLAENVAAQQAASPSAAPAAPPSSPPQARPPARPAGEPDPLRWGFGVQLAVDAGLGPEASFHPRPFVSFSKSNGSIRLSAARPRSRSSTEAGTASLDWTLIRAAGCYELRSPDSWLGPCAGLEGGSVKASGSRTARPRSQTEPSFAVVALVQGGWRLVGALALEVDGGLRVPFARQRFFFGEDTEAYEIPGLAFTGGVGLHFRAW